MGLVASVEDGLLHTIEGNVGNSVRRLKYELTNPMILGYGLIPDQPEENTELILTEQTIQAVIYTDATLEQPAEDATVILISGMLPEGAVAVAYPVKLESNLIEGETILSLVTTLPAPITELSPIVTPGITRTPAPSQQFLPICTGILN